MIATKSGSILAESPAPVPNEGRLQLALNVDNLESAIGFYSKLFGTPPAKLREGYANFAVQNPPLKLVLIENPGQGGTINHLGVEVPSQEKVRSEIARLTDEGLFTDEEIGTTCCFALQDKVWVQSPGGERWEVYTVLADSEVFRRQPQDCRRGRLAGVCCGQPVSSDERDDAKTRETACC